MSRDVKIWACHLLAVKVGGRPENKFARKGSPRDANLHNLLGELSLDAADVLLLHLPVPDLVLHLAGLLGAATEQQESRRQPVQPVDRPQVLQVVFFGENKDHRVVAIPAARMNLRDRARRI